MTSAEDPGLAAALGRTRKSYDETPYISAPMMRSHPGRMAAQAVWRGLEAPDAACSRVLEIGCATGGNILPLAAALPESRFLGVDLSPVQIATGEARRLRYGLENVELRADSFENIGESDGEFDFIICHGVYSWIPEPLRETLMRVARARLAPNGVALVSFNVLPGWRLFQIARDSMLLNARMIVDPAQRAEKTRELFARLAHQSTEKHTYGKFWRDEALRMASGGDAYLAHEIFEESNAPETFADFTARAARWDLDYLSEAVVAANNEADLAPDAVDSIRELADGDRWKRETYIDIFSGRSFREALLVRGGRMAAFSPSPPSAALERLHFIPALDLEMDGETPDGFRVSNKDTTLAIPGLDAAPALRRLVASRPRSVSLADLVSQADTLAPARAVVEKVLRAAVESGLAAISTLPIDCAIRLGERPKVWRLVGFDAAEGARTATRRHSPIQIEPLQRFLAPLADGTRTRDDLVAATLDLSASGVLTVGGPDGNITDPARVRERLEIAVDQALDGFLRNAILVED